MSSTNNQSSKGKVSQLLNFIDLFSSPIYLHINGKRTLSSSLGVLFSIVLILVVLAQASNLVIKMFRRSDPEVAQISEYQYIPQQIVLSPENLFNFAVGITINGSSYPLNQSLVNISASYNQYYRLGNNSRTKYINSIDLAPCTPESFPFDPSIYPNYALNTALCPTNVDFSVQGTYLSNAFEFLQFNITQCDPSTNHSTGLSCATPDYIASNFNYSIIKVNLYYSNNNIDPLNYSYPSQTFFDSIFFEISNYINMQADIFLDIQTVQNYDSFLSTTTNTNQTYYSIDPSTMREQQAFVNSFAQPLLQFNIRRSTFNYVTIRNYLKVTDVLANLGGFSKSIIFIFAILAAGYIRFKYQMTVSNNMYDFEKEKNEPTNKSDSMDAQKKEIKEYFQEHLSKRKKLDYSPLSYFKSFFCCAGCKHRNNMIKNAENHAKNDTDILQILHKLKEIDKLKLLIMNHYQREIFNFSPKPILKFDETNGAFQRIEKFDKYEEYYKLYLAYIKIKREGSKERASKLTNMLGEELIRIFNDIERVAQEKGNVNLSKQEFESLVSDSGIPK